MKDVLQQPASYLLKSEHMLAGKLEAAIRASNAQYEEPEASRQLKRVSCKLRWRRLTFAYAYRYWTALRSSVSRQLGQARFWAHLEMC